MEIDTYKLKIQMARAEMNINELAIASRMSKNTIASYTSGKRNASTKKLGRLAKTLNCDVTDLI